jgi:hypothetical protein
VARIEAGDPTLDGFDDIVNIESGTLAVNTGTVLFLPPPSLPLFLPASWRMEGEMNFINTGGGTPTLNGSPMVVSGTVNVTGGLAEVNARVVFEGGAINVDAGSTLQQDGIFTQQGGTLTVVGGGTMLLNNTTTFQATSNVSLHGLMELNGDTTFEGGTWSGTGVLRQDGNATIASTTTLNIDTRFRGGSKTDIASGTELRLGLGGVVRENAEFTGGGRLRNLNGSQLSLEDGATVDATLVNEGAVVLGNSPGTASVDQYVQTASGLLDIEIGGLAAGTEYDVLRVNEADLAGELAVSLIDLGGGVFLPGVGDTFEVIRGNNILGVFNTEPDQSFAAGSVVTWEVLYDPTSVVLEVIASALAGDFDEDGDVDGDDFLTWQASLGTLAGASHMDGDADGDGDVDGDDFLAWQGQFGMSGGSASLTAVPEPATAGLLAAGILAIVASSRRRR